jgi:ribosomal protein S18 acetylase RimI-like enzyme
VSTLAIRAIEANDAAQVNALMAVATAELRRIYRPRTERLAQTAPESAPALRLVATEDTHIVGVVDYLTAADAWHLRGLAVDPARRRSGVARALVERVAALAHAAGATRLTLSTIKETGNPTIFLRLGFTVTRESAATGFEGGTGTAVVQVDMVRVLASTATRRRGFETTR